ncbi:MAG TPA: hypothetical protein VGO58_17085 [Chitinophagaceae bacterium]|nr:hypothetical protein [Chitinophagaceae bacterium]
MTFLDISSWWQALPSFEKTFWVIALLFSLLFLIQVVLSFTGGDHGDAGGDADATVGSDDGTGHQFFTIKNMIAFFTIFGWTGIACIKGGMGAAASIGIAVGAGSVVVVIMALLFRGMNKLKQSGTLQTKNAVGVVAETYLFIPAKRGGFGKIHIRVQGSLHELQAITDDEEQIPTGKLVKVTGTVNDSVLLVTSNLS